MVEGIGQPVVHHGVDQHPVAEPVAGTGPGEQVGRLRHRLHPARHHDLRVTGPDHLIGQVDGVQPREAHLVDGVGRHRQGDPGLDGRLPGGNLTLAGLEDLAHEDVVHLVGGDSGPRQGLGDGEPPQLHGGEAAQPTRQLADGGPSASDDDGLSHDHYLRICCRSSYRSETTSYGPAIVGAHERHPQCRARRGARRGAGRAAPARHLQGGRGAPGRGGHVRGARDGAERPSPIAARTRASRCPSSLPTRPTWR